MSFYIYETTFEKGDGEMTETNSERLKDIKMYFDEYEEYYSLSTDSVKWLIERAERVQNSDDELRKERRRSQKLEAAIKRLKNRILNAVERVESVEKENERLRNELEQIVNIDGVFVGWNEEFNPKTAYQLVDDIARQALEKSP